MPRRPSPRPDTSRLRAGGETLEDRWLREAQTARNLAGLEAEQAGRVDEAIALYERNAREGFPGDWPYGRLVAIYEKREALAEAERVLRRAIEVLQASTLRTAQERRTVVRTFRRRLALLRKRAGAASQQPRSRPPA